MNKFNISDATELPSKKQLLRSTIVAAFAAAIILVVVVLPAEFGIDPTGIGRVLQLTEMGKIKTELSKENLAETKLVESLPVKTESMTGAKPKLESEIQTANLTQKVDAVTWRDEVSFVLSPGEGREVKLKMSKGAKASYLWVVEGGAVNFDTHGDAIGNSISYEKGRGAVKDEGTLEAAFTGKHGWYWRNRGQSNVKVILQTNGDYTEIN